MLLLPWLKFTYSFFLQFLPTYITKRERRKILRVLTAAYKKESCVTCAKTIQGKNTHQLKKMQIMGVDKAQIYSLIIIIFSTLNQCLSNMIILDNISFIFMRTLMCITSFTQLFKDTRYVHENQYY